MCPIFIKIYTIFGEKHSDVFTTCDIWRGMMHSFCVNPRLACDILSHIQELISIYKHVSKQLNWNCVAGVVADELLPMSKESLRNIILEKITSFVEKILNEHDCMGGFIVELVLDSSTGWFILDTLEDPAIMTRIFYK